MKPAADSNRAALDVLWDCLSVLRAHWYCSACMGTKLVPRDRDATFPTFVACAACAAIDAVAADAQAVLAGHSGCRGCAAKEAQTYRLRDELAAVRLDAMRLKAERDAAIRERDEARRQCAAQLDDAIRENAMTVPFLGYLPVTPFVQLVRQWRIATGPAQPGDGAAEGEG